MGNGGCGWVEMVYDRNNRLVFTGDSEQQKRGECSFSIADQLGREVLNGVYQGALPDRNNCDASDIYAVFSPGVAGACEGYRINCPTGISLEKLKVLQANYYDRYTFASTLSGFGGGLGYVEDASVGKRYSGDPELHCKDLLTGRMTMVLGGNQKLYNTYYYDYDRNLIQERHTTLNGKIVVNKSSFNFSGQPVKAIEEYGTEISAQKSYSYDHMGRMIREVHTLGKDSTEFIYSYDLQDRIIRQTRIHGLDSLATDNRYNIRGWIEAIESPLFSQKLHYTDGSGTPCYNGNISSMTCKGNDKMTRGYKFTYDGVSRMTDATYGEGDLINANPNRFTEQVTGYDKNGNILGLKRYGQTGASSYGLIDNLSLTLNGNQLKVVNDAVTTSAYNNGFEFKDGAKVTTEYTYDTNGNLTKDLNKNIISIQYNMLNLPSIVSFSDGSTITYTYSADGTKLRIVHKIDSAITTTDYLGNVVYENGVAKLLLTGYGYVSLNDKKYHYYLQDHQGNNRVVVDSSGKVEETNHYYPFGGTFASTGNVQPYKYNGKELDAKKGLNWYDYGARMYDAALGRWHVVDPMAEKYCGMSPYAYCNNSPTINVDLDGKDWYMHSETGELYFSKNRDQWQFKLNDRIYYRIGDNDMLGDMKDVTERAYNYDESLSLAQDNGYSINPIQEILSEVSREQPYSTGKKSITVTTGEIEIINEKYGIFPVEKSEKKNFKTDPLYKPKYDVVDYLDAIATGAKKVNLIERNYFTYNKPTLGDKTGSVLGTVYGVMETMTGKHDYRNVRVYKNWNSYLKTTGGKGRMLLYRK